MKSGASPFRTLRTICGFLNSSWSRREDLNTPSADYNSAALPLSYTSFEDNLQISIRKYQLFSVNAVLLR